MCSALAELGRFAVTVGLIATLVSLALDCWVAVVVVGSLDVHHQPTSFPEFIDSRNQTHRISKVGVDAHKLTAIHSSDAFHVNAAGAVALAVSA